MITFSNGLRVNPRYIITYEAGDITEGGSVMLIEQYNHKYNPTTTLGETPEEIDALLKAGVA